MQSVYFLLLVLLFPTVFCVQDVCMGSGFICVLLESGDVRCFGENTQGQLGRLNTSVIFPPPTTISNIKMITCGQAHVCVVDNSNVMWCWGSGNSGELGNNDTKNSQIPIKVSTTDIPIDIQAGNSHTCYLMTGGIVKCFGTGVYGALGTGSTNRQSVPIITFNNPSITALYVSSLTTCVSNAGQVQCFGSNFFGDLSIGLITSPYDYYGSYAGQTSPLTANLTKSGVVKMTGGGNFNCWLFNDNTWSCSGYNAYGVLAYGNNVNYGSTSGITPSPVHSYTIADIEAYNSVLCILFTNNSIGCFGSNSYGELGIGYTSADYGTLANQTNPQLINIPSNLYSIKLVSSPSSNSQICILALDTNYNDGIYRVYAWGSNGYNQLSSGSTSIIITNVPLMALQTNCGNSLVEPTEGEQCDGTPNCSIFCKFINGTTSPTNSLTSTSTSTMTSTSTSTPKTNTATSSSTSSNQPSNNVKSSTQQTTSVPPTIPQCMTLMSVNSSCINNTLYINNSLNIDTNNSLTLSNPTIIIGNFTVSGTIVLGSSANISVEGCAFLSGSLVLDMLEVNRTILNASCIQGKFNSVSVSSEPCLNIFQKINQPNIIGASLELTLVPENLGCSKKSGMTTVYIGIGVAIIVLVITVISIVFMLYLVRNGRCRRLFREIRPDD